MTLSLKAVDVTLFTKTLFAVIGLVSSSEGSIREIRKSYKMIPNEVQS